MVRRPGEYAVNSSARHEAAGAYHCKVTIACRYNVVLTRIGYGEYHSPCQLRYCVKDRRFDNHGCRRKVDINFTGLPKGSAIFAT